jgi:drug/metabolite transporter (DMT)-like permease
MSAIFYSLGCAVCWGFSYTFLSQISDTFKSTTINILYGLSLIITNLVWSTIFDELKDFKKLIEVPHDKNIYLFAYILFVNIANFVFMRGLSILQDISFSSIYISISSTYPIFKFLFSYILYANQRNYKLELAIPGILIVCGGLIMLIFSKI